MADLPPMVHPPRFGIRGRTRQGLLSRRLALLGAAGAVATLAPKLHAQVWSGMTCVTGSWTTSECWCTDCQYPNASSASAEIQLGEPSIGPGLGIQLLGLSTQTGGSVLISGDLLYYGSAITNAGQIRLLGGRILPLGTDSPFTLTLGGPGRLVLDGAPAFQAGNIVNLYGTTLINTQSHTIAGARQPRYPHHQQWHDRRHR